MNAAAALTEVRVPDMGSFKDVAVIEVLVKPGDRVAVDTPLVTLESEKATMDVPSTADGVIDKIHAAKGGTVNTGDLIATLRAGGAEAQPATEPAAQPEAPASEPPKASAAATAPPAAAAVAARPAAPAPGASAPPAGSAQPRA